MNFLFIVIIINEYKIKSLSLLFWGATYLSFCLPHSIDVMLKSSYYPDEVLYNATVYVSIFCFLFLLLRYVTTYGRSKNLVKGLARIKKLSNIENKFINYAKTYKKD
jgi:hypothetical protein